MHNLVTNYINRECLRNGISLIMFCEKCSCRVRGFLFLTFLSTFTILVVVYFQRYRIRQIAPDFFKSSKLNVQDVYDATVIQRESEESYKLMKYISAQHSSHRRRSRIGDIRNGTVFDFYSLDINNRVIEQEKQDVIKQLNDRSKVSLDCYNMFKLGPTYEHMFPNRSLSKFKKAIKQREDVIHATIENCVEFKNIMGYITEPLTDLEKSFSIAYSIVMFKDFLQVEMLLRSIYRPQNIYCIHIDKKTEKHTRELVNKLTCCFDNVFVANASVNVTWGGFSVLEADLVCLRELLIRSKTWKYFINLTGQEYPLRTNYELVKILSAFNGANNIEGVKRVPKARLASSGPSPYNMTAVKGSIHVVLSRDFAKFSVNDPKALKVLKWSEKVALPDEIFFSTLNYNRVLKAPGSYRGLYHDSTRPENPFLARFKNWLYSWLCHGKYVRFICIFGIGDLHLLAVREELFANKFHLEFSEALLCMEELIYNRTVAEYLGFLNFNASYYGSRDFVKNRF